MFGLLFGYGVAQIVRRQRGQSGRRAVRRMLWRRSLVLVVVGFLHAMLLYAGDILAAYGVLLFLGVWAVRWTDGWLLALRRCSSCLVALPRMARCQRQHRPAGRLDAAAGFAHPVRRADRGAPIIALLGPIGFACPFLVGLWAGRRRILEQPERHRGCCGGDGAVGIGAAVLGAQPVSLVLAGVLDGAGPEPSRCSVRCTTPPACWAGSGTQRWWHSSPSGCDPGAAGSVDAIAAVGQRSMTCYLAQSVVWTVVFTPFLLDLSDDAHGHHHGAAGDRDLAGHRGPGRVDAAGGPAGTVRDPRAPRDLRTPGRVEDELAGRELDQLVDGAEVA